MYNFAAKSDQLAIRQILAALMRHSVIWLIALPLGFALLLGLLAMLLLGASPLPAAQNFLEQAAVALSGPAVHLWAVIFFAAALCFGISRSLPQLLLHRPLNGGLIARFTQAVAIRAASPDALPIPCAGVRRQRPMTRRSRTPSGTATHLAGAAPRLQ